MDNVALAAACAVLVVVAAAWLRAHSARLQWDNDEGIYVQQAWSLLQGYRLYSDVWIDHPPGFPYLLAGAFAAMGRSLDSARWVTLLVSLLGVPAVALVARRAMSSAGLPRASGLFAAGVFAPALLLASQHFYWLVRSVNPDLPSMALAVLGLGVAWSALEAPARQMPRLLAAGALLGAAATIKLSVAVVAAPLLVLLVARARSLSYREAFGDGILVALAAVGVCSSWLVAGDPGSVWAGAIGVVGAARGVYPSRAAEYASWLVTDNLLGENVGLTALAAFGLLWLSSRAPWRAGAMTAWLLATVAALVFQRPMWPRHHWSLVLWPLSVLAGVAGAVLLLVALRRCRLRRIELAVGLTAFAIWFGALVFQTAALRSLTNPPQFAAVADGAQWIAENLARDDLVISDSGMVSFLSGRPMPPEAVPMSSKRLAIGDLTGEMLVRASERDHVRAVLLWNNQLEDLVPFMDYLPTRFLRVATVGDDREIWRRHDPAALTVGTGTRFEGGLALEGALIQTPAGPAPVVPRVRAGESFEVTLVWRAGGPGPGDLAALLHVSDPDGALIGADESVGTDPALWRPGELVTSTHRFDVPRPRTGDRIHVTTGLYTRSNMTRLAATGPDGSPLAGGLVELFSLQVE
jgi:4-amino-4-deoxy-L-arabinose transferase-like glycosyltransferase